MDIYRYSEWDGNQDLFSMNAEAIMDELGHELMSFGDISYVLRLMQRTGIKDGQGQKLPGIQSLLQQLRKQKQSQLDKYNLGSVIDEIRQKLDNILKTERHGIQKRLDETRQKAKEEAGNLSPEMQQKLFKALEDAAGKNLKKLAELPQDTGGKIKELTDYDFMDEEAMQQFQELTDTLKKHAMEAYGRDLVQKLKDMDASTLSNMRHLMEALNQMLEQHMSGEEPDFNSFIKQFGGGFGDQPPQNFDELMELAQHQIAQAKSLMESLSPSDREELQNLLQSMIDDSTQYEMAKFAANLENLNPGDKLHRQYPFSGEESISYSEALKLMESLQKMDKLETQLKESQYNRSLDSVDERLIKEVMGDEAAADLAQLRNLSKVLEEGSYIRWKDGKYELTPRGMRRIGQKALEDIFTQLRKDRIGGHRMNLKGVGGEQIDETRKYEFGDDFRLHLQKTLMNSLYRKSSAPPVKLDVKDFEVFGVEESTRSATVLMIDLSLSMPMRGNFQAAKRVVIALDSLIRSWFPKDSLYVVGFSSYARQMKKEELAYINWDEFDPYTNMQHGLYISSKLLAKERSTNKQIILISDGEPTAHVEGGNIYFQYPPSLQTLQLTLKEVQNCTRQGIVINTFMLESNYYLNSYMTKMARLNKGRIFFTSADNLGQYLMVDYISNKKRKI
ncbi:VWA domain-containing protein [Chloroflexota bacterium]